jgi:hypothetical protein
MKSIVFAPGSPQGQCIVFFTVLAAVHNSYSSTCNISACDDDSHDVIVIAHLQVALNNPFAALLSVLLRTVVGEWELRKLSVACSVTGQNAEASPNVLVCVREKQGVLEVKSLSMNKVRGPSMVLVCCVFPHLPLCPHLLSRPLPLPPWPSVCPFPPCLAPPSVSLSFSLSISLSLSLSLSLCVCVCVCVCAHVRECVRGSTKILMHLLLIPVFFVGSLGQLQDVTQQANVEHVRC